VDRDHRSRVDHHQPFPKAKRKSLKLGTGILQTKKQCLPSYAG
jgi:hypothetical protein